MGILGIPKACIQYCNMYVYLLDKLEWVFDILFSTFDFALLHVLSFTFRDAIPGYIISGYFLAFPSQMDY